MLCMNATIINFFFHFQEFIKDNPVAFALIGGSFAFLCKY